MQSFFVAVSNQKEKRPRQAVLFPFQIEMTIKTSSKRTWTYKRESEFFWNFLRIIWGIVWEFSGNCLGIVWEFFGNSYESLLEFFWNSFGGVLNVWVLILGNFDLK